MLDNACIIWGFSVVCVCVFKLLHDRYVIENYDNSRVSSNLQAIYLSGSNHFLSLSTPLILHVEISFFDHRYGFVICFV